MNNSMNILKTLDSVPSTAIFQCRATLFFEEWTLYDNDGEIIGRIQARDPSLPVVVSQFFNLETWRWTARLDNGQFADAKLRGSSFDFIPDERNL